MGWWNAIWQQQAQEWTYGPLEATQVPDKLGRRPILANTSYLTITLCSMRVVNVRRGLKKFYAAAHSFISMPFLGTSMAEFNAVIAPSGLRNIDAQNVDKVITLNQPLLQSVPYRGGNLSIELGMFSVESADLAAPFLGVLEAMGKEAGVSLVGQAIPFVRPIVAGMNLLLGAQGSSILEIGLDISYSTLMTGYFVVMGAPKDTYNLEDLSVQKDYSLVGIDGQRIKTYPYMLVRIEATPEREDWFSIPELSSAYDELKTNVRKQDVDAVKQSLTVFKKITLTSPDLLFTDAERITSKVEIQVNKILGPTLLASRKHELPELKNINLYEK